MPAVKQGMLRRRALVPTLSTALRQPYCSSCSPWEDAQSLRSGQVLMNQWHTLVSRHGSVTPTHLSVIHTETRRVTLARLRLGWLRLGWEFPCPKQRFVMCTTPCNLSVHCHCGHTSFGRRPVGRRHWGVTDSLRAAGGSRHMQRKIQPTSGDHE